MKPRSIYLQIDHMRAFHLLCENRRAKEQGGKQHLPMNLWLTDAKEDHNHCLISHKFTKSESRLEVQILPELQYMKTVQRKLHKTTIPKCGPDCFTSFTPTSRMTTSQVTSVSIKGDWQQILVLQNQWRNCSVSYLNRNLNFSFEMQFSH